ncbi:hypothetical protein ACQP1V_09905 [Microtetraspora malaysiensis]|uniref:hypothetical protein n=1 Tax=Microtetraspora malaysiensis TaxID=161358 RepID=UPI003D93FC09
MYFNRDPLIVRLGKLADSGQTGVLRVSGALGGAFYLSEGDVVYAESKRTPEPSKWLVQPQGHPGEADTARSQATRGGPAAAVDAETAGSLEWSFAVREATVDAALELLSGGSRNSPRHRFRELETPAVGRLNGMPFPMLLAEVTRRQEIVKQLSGSVTADTTVVRNPHIAAPGLQVSALQWALLIRTGERSTPRDLAWELEHSVFSTTVEVFRLITLRLLSVDGTSASPMPRAADTLSDPRRDTMSFLRAVAQ